MPEKDFRALQRLIRRTANKLPKTEQSKYRADCLAMADHLIDEVIGDLGTDKDRRLVHEKVYRIMIR